MSDEPANPAAQPWLEGARRFRELGDQMSAAARSMAIAAAGMTPPALSQPLARYAEQLMSVNSAITTPLRELLDQQQQFADRMAQWAEQHRMMSQTIEEWATYQRQLNEQMRELSRPFLEQTELLTDLHAEWTRNEGGAEQTGGAPER